MDFIKVIFRMLLAGGWVKYRSLFLGLGIASSVVVGWLDYVTTDEINLSFFYLLPIFFTTMAVGRSGGLCMALACAVIKIITDVYSEQPYARSVYYAFNGLGLFAAFAAFALLLDALRSAYKRECEVYRRDELTGLANHQDFLDVAGEEWFDCKQMNTPFAMLAVDLDNFKAFNAVNGHYVGDMVLQVLARSAGSALGEGDVLYRLGADDFAVVLAEAAPQKVRQAAEHLQQRLSAIMLDKGWRLGVSICIVSCVEFSLALEEVLCRASEELHTAKQDGKSGVIVELQC